jgi:hypothetical protein
LRAKSVIGKCEGAGKRGAPVRRFTGILGSMLPLDYFSPLSQFTAALYKFERNSFELKETKTTL